MQVLLRKSDESDDLRCDMCGQGFRVYWERRSAAEEEQARTMIQEELRQQHSVSSVLSAAVHPDSPFNVPSWAGAPQFSGAALLGGLSTIRRAAPAELDFKG